MNQILMTKDKDNNSSVKFKPTVKFFAIAIIIFAIIFIGEGSYNLYTAKNKEKIFEKPPRSASPFASACSTSSCR